MEFLDRDPEFRLAQLKALDTPDEGQLVVAGDWQEEIRVWDLVKRKGISKFSTGMGPTNEIRFLPNDPNKIAVASDDGVSIWNWKNKELVAILNADNGPCCDVDFAQDGQILAAANSDGTVTIWDLDNLELLER